ncbi:MAG TPA: winged helix DNA-binding domain-containing protein [Acidimicrobiales bacterium]
MARSPHVAGDGGSAEWIVRARMRGLGLWSDSTGATGATGGAVGDVVGRLAAVQAQEHPYALWSVAQRLGANHVTAGAASGQGPTASAMARAFDDGEILRTHLLRPTWHVVAARDLRWMLRWSGPVVHAGNARRYHELELDGRTLARAAEVIGEAVRGGPTTRRELAEVLERKHIATDGQRLAYLVMYAELHAVVCSGPMKGKQHTYAAVDERAPADDGPVDRDHALAEVARRYFATRGPATLKDFGWWSGLKADDTRRALDALRSLGAAGGELETRTVDGRTYYWSQAGRSRVESARARAWPRVDLVQCYDEVIISYTESRDAIATGGLSFAVPRHIDGFTHVLLLDGRLLGHWRATAVVEVETRVGRALDAGEEVALADAVDRYRAFASS